MECHVEGDFLLIWIDEKQNQIGILRLGSHAEIFKKYKHQQSKMDALEEVLKKLRKGKTLLQELDPHRLKGNYKGHMECHVGNDLLLIWCESSKTQ